jgi:hypothetical protein
LYGTLYSVYIITLFGYQVQSTPRSSLNCLQRRALGRYSFPFLYGKSGGAWVGAESLPMTVDELPARFISTITSNFWLGNISIEWAWAFTANWSTRAEYHFIGQTIGALQ